MLRWPFATPLISLALAGCLNATSEPRVPPMGAGEIERERATRIGERRWFGYLNEPVCKDLNMTEGCRSPKSGSATVEAVEGVLSPNGLLVNTVYLVRLQNGEQGYMRSLDFRLMFDDAQNQKNLAAKKECDRKGRTISIGMTGAQVLASCWGKPTRRNNTITASGNREQWVYSDGSYVYVTNGVVTAIQQSSR